MNRFTLIVALVLNASMVTGQELVSFEELSFSSAFEKDVVTDHFKNRKSDFFNLLIANGNALNESAIQKARLRFTDQLTELKKTATYKRRDKNLKFIYASVHDGFLKKYEEQNKFEDIFINGYYNCVSATALFALVFTEMGIPYIIKETPTHVYLVAYPNEEKVIVETTDPSKGSIIINDQYKELYVTNLKNQKLISLQEYQQGNINELFEKHYFADHNDITLSQLVGIQYYNDGVYSINKKRSLAALQSFEKSYVFYPGERVSLGMMEAAHNVFREREARDVTHAVALGKLAKFKAQGITSDMIEGEYARVINAVLFERNDLEKLRQYHTQLMTSVTDSGLKNDLEFLHHYEVGRWNYNQGNFGEGVTNFKECLKLRPGHTETSRLLLSSVAEHVRNRPNAEIITVLERYANEYPMLMENNNFIEMLGTTYLIEMRWLFETERVSDAEKVKLTFENFHTGNTGVIYNNQLVGQAYSSAAVYYFKKGNTSKARSILNKGLQISPNNYELTTRMRMIN